LPSLHAFETSLLSNCFTWSSATPRDHAADMEKIVAVIWRPWRTGEYEEYKTT
jgi:hypothetical protein